MLTDLRKWFSWVCGEISLVFLWICGRLDPDTAVDNITWAMNEINTALETEKKCHEIGMQQAKYLDAVEKGREINGR